MPRAVAKLERQTVPDARAGCHVVCKLLRKLQRAQSAGCRVEWIDYTRRAEAARGACDYDDRAVDWLGSSCRLGGISSLGEGGGCLKGLAVRRMRMG